MAKKMVSLTIDDRTITAPEGTLIVDAAKQAGIDIPVFCYHPKMEPVGMCRMCLVEIGRPVIDRATGQPVLLEDGSAENPIWPQAGNRLHHPGLRGHGGGDRLRQGQGRPQGSAGIPAHLAPAGLPDLRQGRRMPAAKPDHGALAPAPAASCSMKKCTLAKHVAAGRADLPGPRALHPVRALRALPA